MKHLLRQLDLLLIRLFDELIEWLAINILQYNYNKILLGGL